VSNSRRKKLEKRKRRIERRNDPAKQRFRQDMPMLGRANIHYEMADRTRGIACGGVALILRLVLWYGLRSRIDRALSLLRVYLPYHESDHVLNMAFHILAGGKTLDDIELLRNDENYLDALGAERIPDPTTAGDFCRRFGESDVCDLMEAINETRLDIWKTQPPSFFEEAVIDVDGVLTQTQGECKEGMEFSYKKTWGYHPLAVSLANTNEPLYIVNRRGIVFRRTARGRGSTGRSIFAGEVGSGKSRCAGTLRSRSPGSSTAGTRTTCASFSDTTTTRIW